MSLVDMIIDRRMSYIQDIRQKVNDIMTGDIETDFRKFMLLPGDVPENEIFESFVESAKKHRYFLSLYSKIEGKPFTWDTLKEIDDIGGTVTIKHDSTMKAFLQVQSIIDNQHAPFLERLSAFPLIYASGKYPEGFSIEPNCLSASSQIIPVLYSYTHDIKDLAAIEVNSTYRKDTLLEKLRKLYKKDFSDDKEILYHYKSIDYVFVDFDAFTGVFDRESLINMLFDEILYMDDRSHLSVKNKTTSEIYDFDIEKNNFKNTTESDIKKAGFIYPYVTFMLLSKYLGHEKSQIKKEFEKTYEKFPDSIFVNSAGIEIFADEPETALCYFQKIKELYGDEDMPVRYIVLDTASSIYSGNVESIKAANENLKRIEEKYVIPDALDIIMKRYPGGHAINLFRDRLSRIDASL